MSESNLIKVIENFWDKKKQLIPLTPNLLGA